MITPSSGASSVCEYTVVEHRHRFAMWAAARAASRGLGGATTRTLSKAITLCGVAAVASGPLVQWPSSAGEFDVAHDTWCRAALAALGADGVTDATYGRVAKLVAIYLKTMVVVAGAHDTPFGRVIHPPIDELLLRALARTTRFSKTSRRLWGTTTWTKLDAAGYARLIRSLRDEGLDSPAFWKVEEYWRPTQADVGLPPRGPAV